MENTILLVIAGVLTILALVAAVFMAGEVVRLVRDFMASVSEARRPAPPPEAQAAPRSQRRLSGGKSRATVQRMIRAFEESQDRGTSKPEEP